MYCFYASVWVAHKFLVLKSHVVHTTATFYSFQSCFLPDRFICTDGSVVTCVGRAAAAVRAAERRGNAAGPNGCGSVYQHERSTTAKINTTP